MTKIFKLGVYKSEISFLISTRMNTRNNGITDMKQKL